VSCFFDSLCRNKSAEYFLLVVGPMYLASRWASPWLWEVSVDLSGYMSGAVPLHAPTVKLQ